MEFLTFAGIVLIIVLIVIVSKKSDDNLEMKFKLMYRDY